jgi:hypothetical protein
MRTTWLPCLVLAGAAFVSCGKKPAAPTREAATPASNEAPATEQQGDVGIIEATGKTVDYFTGKTHLDAKRRMESKLKEIQSEQNRRLEEALGE